MTNAEKYKDEIREVCGDATYRLAVMKDGHIGDCFFVSCDDCIFCNEDGIAPGFDCEDLVVEWLVKEAEEDSNDERGEVQGRDQSSNGESF